jgi:hypothetical protein
MTPLAIVGFILGGLLALVVIAVFWVKKDFPVGGLGALLVAAVLVSLPIWKSISIKGFGLDIQLLKEEVQRTAAAAEQVAGQVQQTAATVETTRTQIAALAQNLLNKRIITVATFHEMNKTLNAAPRPDLAQLTAARARLAEVARTRPRP